MQSYVYVDFGGCEGINRDRRSQTIARIKKKLWRLLKLGLLSHKLVPSRVVLSSDMVAVRREIGI
jgi:hypothetical protein